MSMSKGFIIIFAFSAIWGCAGALNILLYGYWFGSTPGPLWIGIAVGAGLVEMIGGLFVLDRFTTNVDAPPVFRHPDFEPQPAVATPHSIWIAHPLVAAAGLSAAAGIMLLLYFQFPSPHNLKVASNDSVATNPESHISPKSQRITHNGNEFILRKGQSVTFAASHPDPLKYQWLLHIAGSAKLVASAGKSERLAYTFRQLDSDWGGADSRYEFLVIVTADKVLPGWPESVVSPIELEGLFTRDELRELKDAPLEENAENRNNILKQVVRTALDRRFGVNQCWFQVFVYQSENRE
jgi:hypothetical protein